MIMTTKVLVISFIVLLTNAVFNVNPTLAIPDHEKDNSWPWAGRTGSDMVERNQYYHPLNNARTMDWPKRPRNIVHQDNSFVNPETATTKSFPVVQRHIMNTAEELIFDSTDNTPSKQYHSMGSNDKRQQPFRSESDWRFPGIEQKRLSEVKCEAYGQAVARRVWALPLVGSRPEAISASRGGGAKCGGVHTPLIVGGSKAQSGEFPHMAAIGWTFDGKTDYLCGGTLISDRWVVTAAHCTHGHSGGPSVVRIGAHRLSDESGEVIGIDRIFRHPGYKPPAMYADIALLKLKSTVTFGIRIRPACLHAEYDVAPTRAWATGWGATQFGEERSDVLLKARLNVVDNVVCALRHNRSVAVPRGVVPSMMCAGDPDGGWKTDTCQGDSGGPLQIVHPTTSCLYQLVGITSFGKLCALKDSPGVYTRVSHYLNWIEPIVWPEED